jgi:hypothetical protein
MANGESAKRRNGRPEWLKALSGDDDPVVLDGPEDAISELVDNQEPLRITYFDSEGIEIASVTGTLGGPKRIDPTGKESEADSEEDFGEFAFRRDGVTLAARIPMAAETQCAMFPDGVIKGRLPSGATWAIGPLETSPRS